MAKLGSTKRPAVFRVQSMARAAEVRAICERFGWHFVLGLEEDKPEDLRDLKSLLARVESETSHARGGFVPLEQLRPDLSERETRGVLLWAGLGDDGVPEMEKYVFDESFCSDPACDCCRVLLQVFHLPSRQCVAVINYAFVLVGDEDTEEEWYLDPFNPQSDEAPEILALFESELLSDPAYVARLEQHYHAFREALPPLPATSRMQAPATPRSSSGEALAAYTRSRNQRKRARKRGR